MWIGYEKNVNGLILCLIGFLNEGFNSTGIVGGGCVENDPYEENMPVGCGNCHSNAICTQNESNQFACVCDDGFTGNGTSCQPLADNAVSCNLITAKIKCHQNAKCVYNSVTGKSLCQCNEVLLHFQLRMHSFWSSLMVLPSVVSGLFGFSWCSKWIILGHVFLCKWANCCYWFFINCYYQFSKIFEGDCQTKFVVAMNLNGIDLFIFGDIKT